MFKQMFDFSIQRTWKGAIWFYFFYAILEMLFGALSILVLAFIVKYTVTSPGQYNKLVSSFVFFINNIFYFILCFGFCLLFIFKKKLRCLFSIFLLILSIPLTFIDGSTWGFIPASLLSMFPNRNISE